MADATVDSSPTITTDPGTATAAPSIDALSADQRAHWRLTGEFPASPEPNPQDSAPATPEPAPAASTEASSSPAPEAGTPKRPDPRASENRIPVLLADRAKATERAEKAERELAELRARLPATDAKPGPSPATTTPKAAPATDPEPDPENAAVYPDGVYDRKFITDQAKWAARDAFRQEQARQASTAKASQLTQTWEARTAAATALNPAFDGPAFDRLVPTGSPLDVWFLESPDSAPVMAHLGTNLAELARIQALSPIAQVRELARLELTLAKPTEPAKPATTALAPPPVTLGNRAAIPGDEVQEAGARGDFRAFRQAANRRDIAAARA